MKKLSGSIGSTSSVQDRAAPVRSRSISAASSRGPSSAPTRARFHPHVASQGLRHPAACGQSLGARRRAPAAKSSAIGKIGDIFAHRHTGREVKGASNADHVDLALDGSRERRRTAASFSSISSISIPNMAIAATSPAMRRASRLSTRACPNFAQRCAPTILRDHRRSRQRSDLARLRPYARACADPRLRRRRRARGRSAARGRWPISPRRSRSVSDLPPARTGGAGRVTFVLDARLAADTIEIGELGLSRLLLMNDARFLWLILVPRRNQFVERIDRSRRNVTARALIEEIAAVAETSLDRPSRRRQDQCRRARQYRAPVACPYRRARRAATPPGQARSGAPARRVRYDPPQAREHCAATCKRD